MIGQEGTALNRVGKFILDNRKKFFAVTVVRHWNRFPRETREVPSLEIVKTRLNGALSKVV